MAEQHLESGINNEAVMQGRRRLLRAAAAVAPVIATLPNGAAAATASTAQCIITSREASQATGADVVSNPPPSGDTFVREPGKEVVFVHEVIPGLEETVTVYQIGSMTTYYTADGSLFDPNPPPPEDPWDMVSETPVMLLRVFRPTSATGDPVDNPTSVDNCPGVEPIPPRCIFPVSKREPSDEGNMGINTSCLCSVNPTLDPGACPIP